MNKKLFVIFLLSILMATSMANAQIIDDNKYATARGWVRIMEENGWGEWQELKDPPLEHFSLKIGQPIQIKIEVTPKQDSLIHILEDEPTKVFNFDILSLAPFGDFKYNIYGVERKNEDVRWENVSEGKTVGAVWTISPNSNWAGGTAAFMVTYQVNKPPPHNDAVLTGNFFTIIYPYIENEQWQGKSFNAEKSNNNTNDGGNNITGFEIIGIIVFIVAIGIAYIYFKRRRKSI